MLTYFVSIKKYKQEKNDGLFIIRSGKYPQLAATDTASRTTKINCMGKLKNLSVGIITTKCTRKCKFKL